MNRRRFVSLLVGSALALAPPLVARAQPSKDIPIIGFLHGGSANGYERRLASFRQGLEDGGLVEGKDFSIEFRWAEGNYERLREMARELVARKVSVLIAAGGVATAPVAKAATATIPIVFIIGSDPIASGLVSSLARPEANLTGVSFLTRALGAKRLGLLNLLAPSANPIALLMNPKSPGVANANKEIQDAARASKRSILTFEASTAPGIDAAIDAIVRQKAGALIVQTDPFFTSQHRQIAALGTRAGLPAIYPSRDFTEAGGLLSYGADIRDEYRKSGVYAARLLHGARPADLPITQPTKFELVINLKTARAISLSIPDSFQLLADDVIE